MSGLFFLVDILGGVAGTFAIISTLRKFIGRRSEIANDHEASITISMPNGKKIEAKMPVRDAERLVTHR